MRGIGILPLHPLRIPYVALADLTSRLLRLHDIWRALTVKDFKVRYKRSLFGYAWSVLNPLAFTAVLYLAFSVVMRIQVEHFALYLACGMFAWQTFSNSVIVGSTVFIANAALLKKVAFPRWMLVAAYLSSEIIHLALALPVLIVLALLYQRQLDWAAVAWAAPLLLLSQALLCLGPALIIATANVFFRDLERIAVVAINILFYTTPIIYPPATLEPYGHLLAWHPVACQIMSFRGIFYDGAMPWGWYIQGIAGSLVLLAIGMLVYRRGIRRVPEVL